MLHKWFKMLMPKQDEFAVLFAEQSTKLTEAAQALDDLLSGGDRAECGARLGRLEREADLVAERIYRLLGRSFSTPFRRSEIRALVGALDSMVDNAEDVARRMDIYRVEAPTAGMAQMAKKAKQAVALIGEALGMLSNVSKNAEAINELCRRIHLVEDEADQVHDAALRGLYAADSRDSADKARALEKVYDLIEEVVDACEDAANILSDIVAENA